MKKRKQLKSVAHNIISSFVSRNNDVLGYWGMGKLYMLAKQNNSTTVEVDLLSKSMSIADKQFYWMLNQYHDMLSHNLRSIGLGLKNIEEAKITISFNTGDEPVEYDFRSLRGESFKTQCTLTSDLSKQYTWTVIGRCGLHNADVEYKSSRVYDFETIEYINPRRTSKNVTGDFYTVGYWSKGEEFSDCLDCLMPECEAPNLLADIEKEDTYTHFIKQPQTAEEIEQACSACEVCCTSALRYGGKNKGIIHRLGNNPEHCDYVINKSDELEYVLNSDGESLSGYQGYIDRHYMKQKIKYYLSLRFITNKFKNIFR